jgi:regulator of protease activity HflC (stomatin/prohibitin superfamily)
MEIELECETKTVDNVFVQVKAAIQYNIPPNMAQAAYYTLEYPENQMRAYVYDAIRAKIPTMTVEEAFSSKDAVSDNILHALSDRMGQYGFQIMTVLIKDISPNEHVKQAMNEINASKRIKMAAFEKAEAEKLLKVTAAQGESESMYLSGVGMARKRKAIMEGLKESILAFQGEGTDKRKFSQVKDVLDLLVMNQYFDTLSEVGRAPNTKLIFTDGSNELRDGLIQANRGSI